MYPRRRARQIAAIILITLLFGGFIVPALAQGGPTGQAIVNLHLRGGPGEDHPLLATLPRGTVVAIVGRNRWGNWAQVQLPEGTQGWVASRFLIWSADADLAMLPVVDGSAAEPAAEAPTPPADEAAAFEAQLAALPVVPETVSARVWEIFQAGQALGNNPHVFAKVGDCHTHSPAYLTPFGYGDYDLGPYAALQPTIAFFDQPISVEFPEDSFHHDSLAAQGGYTAWFVSDARWANPACNAGESSLECEYRRIRPAVSLIMFGLADIHYMTVNDFTTAMWRNVDLSIARGAIPVLNTFPYTPNGRPGEWELTMAFNRAIADIAAHFDIPLINLWAATRSLPNGGLLDDLVHMTGDGAGTLIFDEAHLQEYAYSVWNLLTLQVLDLLRREVLEG